MRHSRLRQLKSVFAEEVQDLYPGYFAVVMATGIVSIAAFMLQMEAIARSLFVLNVCAYVILWFLTIFRLARYSRRMVADYLNHMKSPGFFTIVAGTCVLGSQFFIIGQNKYVSIFLFLLGLTFWVGLIYGFFTAMTIKDEKPGLENGINGAWLISIVATQSVAILGTLLAPYFPAWKEVFLFMMLSLFLFGCMLYILIILLIFLRFTFYKLKPDDLSPPYWINMGAVAITTLAGATLILHQDHSLLLQNLSLFLSGFTLFYWATGTWWIPLLLILGTWRHVFKRVPLRYDPQFWGMVFPLGMYTACTFQLAKAIKADFLFRFPEYFIYLAFFAWATTFIGWLRTFWATFFIRTEARV